jgi:hypothetical protein
MDATGVWCDRYPWETPALAAEVRDTLEAIEAPPVDADVMFQFQKTLYRGPPAGQAGAEGEEGMTGIERAGRFVPTAIRMRAIRRASAYPTPKAFCEFLGISVSRLSNVENGHPISRMLQDIIVKKMPWISRSFLMDGNEDALTGFALQKLVPLLAEESDPMTPRRRSPSR